MSLEQKRILLNQLDEDDPRLIADFRRVESFGKDSLYQYLREEHIDSWLAAVDQVSSDIETQDLPLSLEQKRILLNQLDVYSQTANILGRITVSTRQLEAQQAEVLPLLRASDQRLAMLRNRMSEQLSQEVSRSYRNNRNILFVTTLATLGLAMFIGLVISRSVANPIIRLRDAVVQLGSGDLDTRVDIPAKDETGVLARSFNQMAESLQQTTVSRDYVENVMTSMGDTLLVVTPQGRSSRPTK